MCQPSMITGNFPEYLSNEAGMASSMYSELSSHIICFRARFAAA